MERNSQLGKRKQSKLKQCSTETGRGGTLRGGGWEKGGGDGKRKRKHVYVREGTKTIFKTTFIHF